MNTESDHTLLICIGVKRDILLLRKKNISASIYDITPMKVKFSRSCLVFWGKLNLGCYSLIASERNLENKERVENVDGKSRKRWEDNIKIDRKETGHGDQTGLELCKQSRVALWVHRTLATAYEGRHLAMGAQQFETLHWSAENHLYAQNLPNMILFKQYLTLKDCLTPPYTMHLRIIFFSWTRNMTICHFYSELMVEIFLW